ncbi:hypothetical protein SK128_005091 [Halocaridina rubra]|uniref:Uncharacterized protein n=1 Tax=Halocaridina rubra TaxID=373956 RepID=A0AAN8ZPP1_HALRR
MSSLMTTRFQYRKKVAKVSSELSLRTGSSGPAVLDPCGATSPKKLKGVDDKDTETPQIASISSETGALSSSSSEKELCSSTFKEKQLTKIDKTEDSLVSFVSAKSSLTLDTYETADSEICESDSFPQKHNITVIEHKEESDLFSCQDPDCIRSSSPVNSNRCTSPKQDENLSHSREEDLGELSPQPSALNIDESESEASSRTEVLSCGGETKIKLPGAIDVNTVNSTSDSGTSVLSQDISVSTVTLQDRSDNVIKLLSEDSLCGSSSTAETDIYLKFSFDEVRSLSKAFDTTPLLTPDQSLEVWKQLLEESRKRRGYPKRLVE